MQFTRLTRFERALLLGIWISTCLLFYGLLSGERERVCFLFYCGIIYYWVVGEHISEKEGEDTSVLDPESSFEGHLKRICGWLGRTREIW